MMNLGYLATVTGVAGALISGVYTAHKTNIHRMLSFVIITLMNQIYLLV